MTDEQIVDNAVSLVRPILAGIDPDLQGAIMANLVAMWLAGHRQKSASGKLEPATELREYMLTEFVNLIERLTPLEDDAIDMQLADGTYNIRNL